VEHAAEHIKRLERAIEEVIENAPAAMRAVIGGLQALRGIAKLSAVTIATEVGSFSRFATPRPLMGYSGMVSSEHSSGERKRQGAITKTGNAHLRRVAIEAAWAYRHRPSVGDTLRQRQRGQSEEVKEIAWKAQHRLHHRYRRLTARGKAKPKVITAIARELLGFLWHIGVTIEKAQVA
jgi:transposase